MSDTYDALVIGAGPGGATTALLLARAGWRVAVCEQKSFPRRKVCGEYLSATNGPLFDRLGLGDIFRAQAGPDVTRVGLFAGDAMLTAELPRPAGNAWGRAIGRETLDTLLLERASAAGANVLQPWTVRTIQSEGAGYCVGGADGRVIRTNFVIAAHGSWQPGTLPTQPPRRRPRSSDLLAFKAHFDAAALPTGLMPLLAFPGGYGGMVATSNDRVSISLCIRRDTLERLRSRQASAAADVVHAHVMNSCRGVRGTLANTSLAGPWLASGPLRPGVRSAARGRLWAVGNAAGEAHPVIAEGISMAMQAAWLATQQLLPLREASPEMVTAAGQRYAVAWKRAFGPRLRAAAAIAHWAMRPSLVAASLPVVRRFPAVLSWGARLSGKAVTVVP